MDWKFETYRKLFVRVDANWLSLPVSARGLGSELLRYCDDAGRIRLGGDHPGEAVSRLTSAKRSEWDRVNADVAALLADGYVVLDGDALVIRNFEEAQGKTKGAKRTEAWRARKSTPSGVTESVTRDVTGDAVVTSPRDAPVTSPERRSGDVSSLPCLALPEEKKESARVRPATTSPDKLIAILDASPDLANVDRHRLAASLRGDTLGGGWSEKRISECLPRALDLLNLSRDPSLNAHGFVVSVVRRLAKPGALEVEMQATDIKGKWRTEKAASTVEKYGASKGETGDDFAAREAAEAEKLTEQASRDRPRRGSGEASASQLFSGVRGAA